jgi:hypothetical protein
MGAFNIGNKISKKYVFCQISIYLSGGQKRRHDIQHNDTQQKGLIYDTLHK